MFCLIVVREETATVNVLQPLITLMHVTKAKSTLIIKKMGMTLGPTYLGALLSYVFCFNFWHT